MATRMKKQYQGVIKGKTYLLGGGKTQRSVWFDRKRPAQDWLKAMKGGNEAAGAVIASTKIDTRMAERMMY